jgi:hypothetical protein
MTKMHLLWKNDFKMLKCSDKFLSVHMNILCSPTKFCGEKIVLAAQKLSFLHRPKKKSFSWEPVNVHIMCRCTPRKFYELFFCKMYFLAVGASTSMGQIGFPIESLFHTESFSLYTCLSIYSTNNYLLTWSAIYVYYTQHNLAINLMHLYHYRS